MELIKTKGDGWCFEMQPSGERFFPFGANFVFDCPETGENELNIPFGRSYNIMTSNVWFPHKISKALKTAGEANLNVMKVFLPMGELSDDNGNIVDLKPSLDARLRFLLNEAEENNIYISLCIAEWGTFAKKWWTNGGEFFGEHQSFNVYRNIWRHIAKICKDSNALFSYNLAVEFYVTAGHWGSSQKGNSYVFSDEFGLKPWQDFLEKKYVDIETLNKAWESAYKSFCEVPSPVLAWNGERYSENVHIVADYNDFKECVTYRFLKMQVDAIREVDSVHMITAGFHPDQCGIVNSGKGYKTSGIVQRELASLFDYVTLHLYTHNDCLIYTPEPFIPECPADEYGMLRRRRACEIYARFIYNGVPVMLEEFGYAIENGKKQFDERINIIKQLYGSVSGYMIWFLGDISGTTGEVYGVMDKELNITQYGEQWAELVEKGGLLYDYPEKRTPPGTVIKIPRDEGLAPVCESVSEKVLYNWDAYVHPVDYEWELSPYIERDDKDYA